MSSRGFWLGGRTAIAAVLGVLVATSTAQAGEIKERQENQDQRIDAGIDAGTVTKHEQSHLDTEQKAIDNARDKALANDGKIGKKERRQLTRAQNRASRHVYRAKHNKKNAAR
jgi:hypothetical protein